MYSLLTELPTILLRPGVLKVHFRRPREQKQGFTEMRHKDLHLRNNTWQSTRLEGLCSKNLNSEVGAVSEVGVIWKGIWNRSCLFLHTFPDYVPLLRALCRVDSGINKPSRYQESLSKEVIFLEVIGFDAEMQLPAVKGQLSPANGLWGILLLRICQERVWETQNTIEESFCCSVSQKYQCTLRLCIRKGMSVRNRESWWDNIADTAQE